MSAAPADRNLLFGILALQMDFVTKDALVAAMHAWVLAKGRPLGDLLADQGALTPEHRTLLEALVRAHLAQHGGDPQKSLAALSSLGPARRDLERIADPDVQASLAVVAARNGIPASPPHGDGLGVLTALLRRWDVARRAGRPLSAEELCRDCPERLDEMRRQIAVAELLSTRDDDPYRTAAPPPEAAAPAPVRYRVLRPHAKGGLGEVFVAEDTELNRAVALKEIQDRYADDKASRARFVAEAEITGGLEHPGIVPVYGLRHYAGGRPFYAMRFIKGDSLQDAIRRYHAAAGGPAGERNLAFRELLRRFVAVCEAVAYAHSRGVLHRDLKPANVMLGGYGETLVVDWGLAKPVGRPDAAAGEATLRPRSAGESSATAAGQVLGTPAYMSPEQAAGRLDELGPASDVYSLGATLYEVLTGRVPFTAKYAAMVLEDVQAGRVPPPRGVQPGVPKALQAVCLKAMARAPADRYPTALALAADVDHWLADEPVGAYREPASARAWRWVRRHRTLTSTMAALVVAVAAGLGLLAWQRERARAAVAAEQAETARERDAKDVALREAESQRDAARVQTDRTRRALDTMISTEMVEALGRQKEVSAAQKAFLRTALGYYREFAAAAATDEAGRKLEAAAQFRVGYLLQALGQGADAEAAYRAALALRERLAADFPAVPEYRRDLATSHNNLGNLLRGRGQAGAAEAAFRAALAAQERLADAVASRRMRRWPEGRTEPRPAFFLVSRQSTGRVGPRRRAHPGLALPIRRPVQPHRRLRQDQPEGGLEHHLMELTIS
jgi:serine/threonine-protein kinase